MYRLHNIGIEAKIDWLIKNGRLEEKRLIISPWNEDTIRMYNYLRDKYRVGALENSLIVDDEVSKFNKKVLSTDALNSIELDASYVALYSSPYLTFEDLLAERGVPCENIYNIKGDNLTAQDALIKCCEDKSIKTVLDVGCGRGNHSRIFGEYGKEVTGIDIGAPCRGYDKLFKYVQDDFIKHIFDEQYDLVWCAHVLEHQLAVGPFIRKLFSCCKETGKVAITVPNEKIHGRVKAGHVNVWNAGLLMYNIIQCGYSCRHAAIKTYASNVSVIVPNEHYMDSDKDYAVLPNSAKYLPENMMLGKTRFGDIMFDGNIEELNWD